MLKEYSNAPVHQVSMAIHFEENSALNSLGLVSRCQNLCEIYGGYRLEEIPFKSILLETERRTQPAQHFEISHGLPKIGCKLFSPDKSIQIEVQNNRFAVAWVRQGGEYPRYAKLKPAFIKRFLNFVESSAKEPLLLKITQCGIQYVNHIDDNDLLAHRCFNFINFDSFSNHEGLNFSTTQRLEHKEEIGRLYLEGQTTFSFVVGADGRVKENRVLKCTLTFRGKPKSLNVTGVPDFLDRGHEAIVDTFSSSLSDKGQEKFGEREHA